MYDWSILSLIIFLPLVGAGMILIIDDNSSFGLNNIRSVALFTTSFTLIASLALLLSFNSSVAEYQFVEKHDWIAGVNYHVGLDGISLVFVLLTCFLMPLVVLASWSKVERMAKPFILALLALQTLILGAFSSLDVLLFFIFFETAAFPIFILMGLWGEKDRFVARQYFLLSLTGSVLMLLGILAMYWAAGGTANIEELSAFNFDRSSQIWFWLAFFLSLAIKIPLFPFHTWMVDAVVKAPISLSVILLSLFTKLGVYAYLRFALPIFPDASQLFADILVILAFISAVWAGLASLAQTCLRHKIAYLAISQIAIGLIGVFASVNGDLSIGLQGALFYFVAHGIIFAGLVICVDMLALRLNSSQISAFGGLMNTMPAFSLAFIVLTLSSFGAPASLGFISNILVFIGISSSQIWILALVVLAMLLVIGVGLSLMKNLLFGRIDNEGLKNVSDLSPRESATILPLLFLSVILGLYPSSVSNLTTVSVERIEAQFLGIEEPVQSQEDVSAEAVDDAAIEQDQPVPQQ